MRLAGKAAIMTGGARVSFLRGDVSADACVFLCSDEGSFVTGASFAIGGGLLARLRSPEKA